MLLFYVKYVYIHTYVYIYVCVYVYIYIYVQLKTKKKYKKKALRVCVCVMRYEVVWNSISIVLVKIVLNVNSVPGHCHFWIACSTYSTSEVRAQECSANDWDGYTSIFVPLPASTCGIVTLNNKGYSLG